jgi:type I restriction enzyme, S subunit
MSEWVSNSLGELVTFQKGRKVETSPFPLPGYEEYLGAGALSGKFDGYGSTFLAVVANENDVLMLWDGERSGLTQRGLSGVVSSTVCKLSPSEAINSDLLYYFLIQNFEWIQNRRTGTGVPHVPKDIGRILRISYPKDRAEQQKISRILQTIDQAIEKTEALIDKYQQIKAGLMHDLFTRGIGADGQLRPPREQVPELYQETPIGWIPKEWACRPLEHGLSASPKNGFSPKEVDTWQDLYVLGLGCLTKSGFRPVQLKNAPRSALGSGAKLEDGDFLISRSNTQELVGLCGIFRKLGHDAIYPDLMMRLRLDHNLLGEFLEKYLLSKAVRQRIAALAVGTSGSMVKLNATSIKELKIVYPSPDEQLKIVEMLKPIEAQVSSLESLLEKLRMQKSGLMHDLLTGKVSVQVQPESEPDTAHV